MYRHSEYLLESKFLPIVSYMTNDLKTILKNKSINGWRLFLLVSIPMSAVMAMAMIEADLTTGAGASAMISFSVRWSVPFIYLVVAASSVRILFPGPFTAWWSRNRKYFGMCFAVAMAWQAMFIFILSTSLRDYYFEDVYLFRDELEGSIGYIFLPAMVITSFSFGRKHLTPGQWKLLHTSGICFLWAYPFSVYWWNLFYYEDPELIDYLFYGAGFLAFASRIAAWGKKRQQAAKKNGRHNDISPCLMLLGSIVVASGLVVAASGLYWQKTITALLTAPAWSADLVLWFPFWPFEPFLSLIIIGIGTMLLTPGPQIESDPEPVRETIRSTIRDI